MAPEARPSSDRRTSPKRRIRIDSRPACTTMLAMPTQNMAMPLSRGVQSKRKVVYSTQVDCSIIWAKVTRV